MTLLCGETCPKSLPTSKTSQTHLHWKWAKFLTVAIEKPNQFLRLHYCVLPRLCKRNYYYHNKRHISLNTFSLSYPILARIHEYWYDVTYQSSRNCSGGYNHFLCSNGDGEISPKVSGTRYFVHVEIMMIFRWLSTDLTYQLTFHWS